MILPGGARAFFFRYSSFRLALLLIVDGLGFFFFFIFFSAFCLLEASSLVSREKLKEPTFSAKLNDRFWLTNAWQSPKHFAARFSSSPHNECIVWREGSSYCRQLSKGDIPLSLACSELLTLRARNYYWRSWRSYGAQRMKSSKDLRKSKSIQ